MASYNLTIQEPYQGCVYQRNNAGFAAIPVVGSTTPGIQTVDVLFTPINGGTQLKQSITVDSLGHFAGSCLVLGGWYNLTVSDGSITAQILGVGSGEVFVTFGHSYLQGGQDLTHQLPANDERSRTLSDELLRKGVNADGSTYYVPDVVAPPKFQFEKLTEKVGPFGVHPDWMGQFSDLLVARLGVPVMLFCCAYGGSNILQSYEILKGIPRTTLPPGTTSPQSRQPFLPLEVTMSTYITKTGIRALFVEHGLNDKGSTREQFSDRFRFVMDYVRATWNKPELAIVLVQEPTTYGINPIADIETGFALQSLIQSYSNTWPGPNIGLPKYANPAWRANNNHMAGAGIDEFAKDWFASITDNFLSSSRPYFGTDIPAILATSVDTTVYSAATVSSGPTTFDWALLGVSGLVLFGIIKKPKNKRLIWIFLLLGLVALARLNGKV